jgi:putative ABC transport system ATP-binding protein
MPFDGTDKKRQRAVDDEPLRLRGKPPPSVEKSTRNNVGGRTRSARTPVTSSNRAVRGATTDAGGTTERPSTPAVRLVDVGHEYGSSDPRGRSRSDRTATALSGVSFRIEPGETVGLEGPSGSGKSTILRAVSGLVVPTAGRVELHGTDLATCADRERTRLRRRRVGIVFRRGHLLPSLSARANVALPLAQAGIPKSVRHGRATALLDDVGLGDRATQLPGELRGGERQRVAIARALATDPDVLVADEPTGELDAATGEGVLELLTEIGKQRTILVASRDEPTLDVADRVVTLESGTVVADERRG